MKNKPDFFLTAAGEVRGDLATPRACWVKARLRDEVRNDYMLVEIEPPLIGQKYGLGGTDITNLIIASRHKGVSLLSIKAWPVYVYVARALDQGVIDTLVFTGDQVEMIGWARIFSSLDEAKAAAMEI